ncbi:hypothetical protein CAEBREN_20697 [Caenorhabditis brenneri]|uniref:Uncharacterized protein n=1 Tax=Caenorhabditis brenneri TaxID=135651 RepID=G0MU24_CAEBE|nr:hypothetical protein CAEBREN_20697 [Caenorhabditis brenneri]
MEIDGGPPPFCGATTTVDDSFDKNPHYDDVDEEESPETSSNLPLPRDSSRSRSVTPVSSLNTLDMTQEVTSSELLEKGDTNVSSTKEEAGEKVEEDDDDWGDFEESTVAPAPIQNVSFDN